MNDLQKKLMKILWEKEPITRSELVMLVKIPRTTIYDNLVKLQKQGYVEKFSINNGKRGRPRIYWRCKE